MSGRSWNSYSLRPRSCIVTARTAGNGAQQERCLTITNSATSATEPPQILCCLWYEMVPRYARVIMLHSPASGWHRSSQRQLRRRVMIQPRAWLRINIDLPIMPWRMIIGHFNVSYVAMASGFVWHPGMSTNFLPIIRRPWRRIMGEACGR